MKYIYVIEAKRFGNPDGHSYIVGCSDKKHAAIEWAEHHVEYRGGKYSCTVWEMPLISKLKEAPEDKCNIIRKKIHYVKSCQD